MQQSTTAAAACAADTAACRLRLHLQAVLSHAKQQLHGAVAQQPQQPGRQGGGREPASAAGAAAAAGEGPPLQTAAQALASVAAAVGPDVQHAVGGSLSALQRQQLWQQLLALLFPGSGGGGTCAAAALRVPDGDAGDSDALLSDSGSDDSEGSWDEGQGGWQEVRQAPRPEQRRAAEQAAGELLAAAADPAYARSSKRCLAAARSALRAYLQVKARRLAVCRCMRP